MNKKQIKAELATLNGLNTLVEAYEEISAMRMRKVKKTVLQNRAFLSGLNDIYSRVAYTYRMYNTEHKIKSKNQLQRTANGKTVSVLLSSNTGLYGDIINKTFEFFSKSIKENMTDVVIVGRTGKKMYDIYVHKPDYTFFDIDDSGVSQEKTKAMLDFILQYTDIVVFHGLYMSVLRQDPVKTLVTGKATDLQNTSDVNELKCLIEPSIEEVLDFFEKQILAAIFDQSIHESSLSKFASRMVSLNYATEHIKNSLKTLKFKGLKLKHFLANSQQLELMSGITLWK